MSSSNVLNVNKLTAGNPQLALLSVQRVELEVHGAGEGEGDPAKMMYCYCINTECMMAWQHFITVVAVL